MVKRWLPLEANPDVMNQFMWGLGPGGPRGRGVLRPVRARRRDARHGAPARARRPPPHPRWFLMPNLAVGIV